MVLLFNEIWGLAGFRKHLNFLDARFPCLDYDCPVLYTLCDGHTFLVGINEGLQEEYIKADVCVSALFSQMTDASHLVSGQLAVMT